jgi:hypothetical protein
MKALVGWLIVLGVSTALWAQGDGNSPRCQDLHIGSTDSGCNNFTSDCPPDDDHGCQSLQFTAQCTGYYDIDTWLTSTGVLTDCKICVYVRKADSGSIVGQCVLDVCAEGRITKTCAGAAALVANEVYNIYVCLTYCDTHNTCNNYCANCTAHGCVRFCLTAPCWLL